MASKTEIITVDDVKYKVTSLNTTPMLALYDELRSILGDSVAASMSKGGTAEDIATRVIFSAFSLIPVGMLQRLGTIFAQTCELGMATTGTGVDMIWVKLDSVYEQHFSARGAHWTKWVIACLKHNYADFLDVFRSSTAKSSPTSGGAGATTSS
jgi:hypothetical protein